MFKSHAFFNPCEYHGFVYIFGTNSQITDIFDPQSDSFFQPDHENEQSQAVLFVYNDELVILTANKATYWQSTGRPQSTDRPKRQIDHDLSLSLSSNMAPVMRGRKIVIAFKGACMVIDVEEWRRES